MNMLTTFYLSNGDTVAPHWEVSCLVPGMNLSFVLCHRRGPSGAEGWETSIQSPEKLPCGIDRLPDLIKFFWARRFSKGGLLHSKFRNRLKEALKRSWLL